MPQKTLVDLLTKIEFTPKEFGHMQKDCPELNKPPQEDIAGPKKCEDYTFTQDLMSNLDLMQQTNIWPQI